MNTENNEITSALKVKRHAYLIMAHDQFGQLEKLIKALDDSDNSIFVHIDKKVRLTQETRKALEKSAINSDISIYNEIKVYWSHYSQVECELYLLEKAQEKGQFQYYHLLSGQDYPIKSQRYIHEFFTKNAGKEFIDYQKRFFDTHQQLILDRVRYYHPFRKYCRYFEVNTMNTIFRGLDKFSVLLQKAVRTDRLGGGYWHLLRCELV